MTYLLFTILILLIVYLVICYFISGTIVYLNRQPVPKNPKDYGMDFEDVEFVTSDKVKIRGWLIPPCSSSRHSELGSESRDSVPEFHSIRNDNKLIILTHVGGLTKYGSTKSYKNLTKLYNKEIEFLKTVKHLHKAGYWVLMFDFRNHGKSGADPNHGMASVGLEEYKDVIAALKYIDSKNEIKDFDIGFVSFCMGANSTIIAASKNPKAFKNVKTIMAIQPISMEVFIRTYLGKFITTFGVKLLLPTVKKFLLLRGSHPLEKMSPRDYVKDLKIPILYVQAKNDPWTELSDIQSFYDNTPAPKEFFWIEGTKHRFESYKYFQTHPEKMLEWLERWI